MVNAQLKESVLVGSCISLSSTVVALSLIKEHEMNLPFVRYMIGVLIIQDVLLGLILGLMPVLSSSMSQAPFTAISIIGSLVLFVVISIVFYLILIKWLLNMTSVKSHESYLAISLGFCISLVLLAEWMDISNEFACFVAGVVIASNELHSEKTLELIGPLKIIFSSLFFTSIGLFIYPSFLLDELLTLGLFACLVVVLKLLIGYLILRFFKVRPFESLKISIGLSQVSEFSLLLSSRAKNVNIIGRETYFTLLGVTILSLLSTPILWYIVNRSSPVPSTDESHVFVKSNKD